MVHPACSSVLFLLATTLSFTGCDASSDASEQSRSGTNAADGPAAGGGFTPDPACSYDCVSPTANDTICVQECDDGCKTVAMRREENSHGSVSVTESFAELCPDQFPEPQLWPLTCELHYGDAQPPDGGCDETFSPEACQAAFDLCLPAD